eukprot:scaffold6813_cov123-Isochrysis_galbana.AAC.11
MRPVGETSESRPLGLCPTLHSQGGFISEPIAPYAPRVFALPPAGAAHQSHPSHPTQTQLNIEPLREINQGRYWLAGVALLSSSRSESCDVEGDSPALSSRSRPLRYPPRSRPRTAFSKECVPAFLVPAFGLLSPRPPGCMGTASRPAHAFPPRECICAAPCQGWLESDRLAPGRLAWFA